MGELLTFMPGPGPENFSEGIEFVRDPLSGGVIFLSPDKVYKDRGEVITRAHLIITPAGREFMRSYSGVLTDIEIGLQEFSRGTVGSIAMGALRMHRSSAESNQSNNFIIEYDRTNVAVVKTHKPENDFHIPFCYLIKMIETTRLELSESMRRIGFSFPDFYFGSSSVGCREYVEGNHPNTRSTKVRNKIDAIAHTMSTFLGRKRKEDPLFWHRIGADIKVRGDYRPENILLQQDGTFCVIDPFFYD